MSCYSLLGRLFGWRRESSKGKSAHSLSSQDTLVSPHEKDSYAAFDTTDRLEVLRGLMKDEGVSMTYGNLIQYRC